MTVLAIVVLILAGVAWSKVVRTSLDENVILDLFVALLLTFSGVTLVVTS